MRVKREQLAALLGIVDDALWAGVVFPEFLPSIATDLLVRGADAPGLRLLAGLDLTPFDPREARATFLEVLSTASVPVRPITARVESAAHVLATAATRGDLTAQDTLRRFDRLAVAADYPDHDEVMVLYGLNDEWIGRWGRSRADIEAEVHDITTTIASRHEPPPGVVIDAVVASA